MTEVKRSHIAPLDLGYFVSKEWDKKRSRVVHYSIASCSKLYSFALRPILLCVSSYIARGAKLYSLASRPLLLRSTTSLDCADAAHRLSLHPSLGMRFYGGRFRWTTMGLCGQRTRCAPLCTALSPSLSSKNPPFYPPKAEVTRRKLDRLCFCCVGYPQGYPRGKGVGQGITKG